MTLNQLIGGSTAAVPGAGAMLASLSGAQAMKLPT